MFCAILLTDPRGHRNSPLHALEHSCFSGVCAKGAILLLSCYLRMLIGFFQHAFRAHQRQKERYNDDSTAGC